MTVADRAGRVVALSAIGGVTTMTGVQGIAPSLSLIQDRFGLDASAIGWATSVYLVPGVVLAFPLGILGDKVGRRLMFVVMGLLFATAGMATAIAPNYGVFLALRFVQGVGFAVLMPITLTILGDAFEGAELLRVQGRRAVAMVAGDFVLPTAGAWLATLGWRAPLLAQGLMFPVAIAAAMVLPAHQHSRKPSKEYRAQLKASMRQRGIGLVLTVGVLRFLFKFTTLAYVPLLLVQEKGASVTQAGAVLSLSALGAAVMATQMARLLPRTSLGVAAAVALVAIGAALLLFALTPQWYFALAIGLLYGAGDGTVSVIQDSFVAQSVPQDVRSGAMALSGSIKNVGKLAAPLLMSALVTVMSIATAFIVMAAVAAAGALAAQSRRDVRIGADMSAAMVGAE